jgi:hypothetical protein
MVLIRSTSDSRIQALPSLYCYLRDGHASRWQSSSLQAQRNVKMHSGQIDEDSELDHDPDTSENICMTCNICQKCGNCLHSGGTRACPWSNLSNKKAKQAGADLLCGWLSAPEKLKAGDIG